MTKRPSFRHRTRWQIALREDLSLPQVARDVGLWLSIWMSTDGASRYGPTVPDLASRTKRSLQTVRRALTRLEEAGWLIRQNGVGRGNLTTYQLMIPVGAEPALEAALTREKGTNQTPFSDPKGVLGMTRKALSPEPKRYQPGLRAIQDARAEPVEPEKDKPSTARTNGAPPPWTWAGMSYPDWLDLPPEGRAEILVRYSLSESETAIEPKEATA